MTENDRQFLVMISKSNPDGATAQAAGRVLAEIDRLRVELKESTEVRQSLTLDNACWQAENRKLGNELAAAKAEPPRPMLTWTPEAPTKPGHYWARDPAGPNVKPRLVTFRRNSDGDLRADYYGFSESAEWWGPVPMPPESP